MEFPDDRFKLDFERLLDLLAEELRSRVAAAGLDTGQGMTAAGLYFYTAIFQIPAEPDPEWGEIEDIRRRTEARRRIADDAVAAGFSEEGIFNVPLRGWIVERLRQGKYQEKMVDTSLVTRLVEQAIADPARLHVLISGDLDMLPQSGRLSPTTPKRLSSLRRTLISMSGTRRSLLRAATVRLQVRPDLPRTVRRQSRHRRTHLSVLEPPMPEVLCAAAPDSGSGEPMCKPCNDARLARA